VSLYFYRRNKRDGQLNTFVLTARIVLSKVLGSLNINTSEELNFTINSVNFKPTASKLQ